MKKFKFNLEAVLVVRKHELEKKQKALMVVERELLENKKRLGDLERERSEGLRAYLEMQLHAPDAVKLMQTYYYLDALNERIERQIKVIEENMKRVEAKRVEVREAHVRKKAIDILKERQFEEYIRECKHEEQKEMDEVPVLRFQRSAT